MTVNSFVEKPAYRSLNTMISVLPKGNFMCEYKVKVGALRDENFFSMRVVQIMCAQTFD